MDSEYDVVFYEDANGCQPVVEYMRLLQGENSKDAKRAREKMEKESRSLN